MGISGPSPDRPIGVFGGTFDPVHNGHLRTALDARELLGLDHVRLVPLAQAVHRAQPQAPAALRLAMLHAAVAGRVDLVVDDLELTRAGPSYTVDTLATLRRRFPGRSLCLLLGRDAFDGFADWRDPDGVLGLANIAVLERPGVEPAPAPAVAALFAQRRVERLDPTRSGQIVACPVTQLDIASRDIRDRLGSGRSIDFLVPDAVLALITRHRLYAPT